MADEYRKILSEGNRATTRGINNAAIQSVKIIRAKFLDDIKFHDLGEGGKWKAIIPNDIDDFDVTTGTIINQIAQGKTPSEILTYIKTPQDTDSPFRWQKSVEGGYREKFLAFMRSLKDTLASHLAQAQKEGMNAFITEDVKSICTIENLSMDMSFNNELTLTISMKELTRLGSIPELPKFFIPHENDVVEVNLATSNNQSYTVFSGLITGISLNKEYGALTSISVVAHGISKVLTMNKIVSDRAVVSQFEGGELAQTGLTPWSQYFANSTIDKIFHFLMTNEMAMQLMVNYQDGGKQTLAIIDAETWDLISYQERIEADAALWGAQFDTHAINTFLDTRSVKQPPTKQNPNPDKLTPLQDAQKSGAPISLPMDVKRESENLGKWYLQARPRETNPRKDAAQIQYAQLTLLSKKISGRLDELNRMAIAKRTEMEQNPSSLVEGANLDFNFHPDSFQSPALFQLMYLPLVTMALYRMAKNKRVARFSGKRAVAFDMLLKQSFTLFFSQMQSPAQLLETVKKTAKFAIYENEEGEIVAELPRYNEFLANDSENIEDFIIYNPIGPMKVLRQDIGLITRVDAKQFWPVVGVQENTIMSRQFTDIAVLAKYGMRPTDPTYNPNAISPQSAQLYAALEVAMTNADTRAITLDHPADRKFRLGRLYFIAVNDLETTGGSPEGEAPTDGYVGYLVSVKMNIQYGSVISYNLNFNYVRKAKLVIEYNDTNKKVITANFKILPDLGGLIDTLETARKKGTADSSLTSNTPNGPVTDRPANTIQANGKDLYTIKRLNEFTGRPQIPFVVAPELLNKLPYLQTEQRFVMDDNNNPAYRITDKFGTHCAPIIFKQDVSGGGSLSQDVIWMLYLIDCRIRAHNVNLYSQLYEAGGVLGPQGSNATTSFQGLYIPNYAINPWYYWTTPVRLNIRAVLNPIKEVATTVGVVSDFDIGNPKALKVRFVGNPIVFKENAPHFCILMIDDSSTTMLNPLDSDAGRIGKMISNITAQTSQHIRLMGALGGVHHEYNGPMYGHTQILDGAARFKAEIASDPQLASSQKRMNDEIDFAITQLQSLSYVTNYNVYLPVVIQGPVTQNSVIAVCPGYAFTLMDIASLCFRTLPGNFPMQKNTQGFYDQHAKGKAIDLTLTPFYAATGLALHDNRAYHPFNTAPMSGPVHGTLPYVVQLKDSSGVLHGTQFYPNGTRILDIVPSISRQLDPRNTISDIFNNALNGKTLLPYFQFNPTNDLPEMDQYWYHVSGIPEFNTADMNKKPQAYKADYVGQVPLTWQS